LRFAAATTTDANPFFAAALADDPTATPDTAATSTMGTTIRAAASDIEPQARYGSAYTCSSHILVEIDDQRKRHIRATLAYEPTRRIYL
jgi:hypothetical protein